MNPDKLYDFQETSRTWLKSARDNGNGFRCEPYVGLIGHEMGLGKTAVALMTVQDLLNQGLKGLFIVPGATTIQWQRQFDKWVLENEPDEFGLTSLYAISSSKSKIPTGFSCVMSHNLLAKHDIIEKLAGADFDFIVIDEIHKFGAHGTKRIKNLWALLNLTPGHFHAGRIGLSGTPVRNYAKEIMNIAKFLGFPTDYTGRFVDEDFARKYLSYDRKSLRRPEQFHADFAPFYLRYTVNEVQKSLPSIRRTKLYTEITNPYLVKAYNKELDLLDNFLNSGNSISAFSLLAYLVRLRHITGIAKAMEPSIIEPIREYLNEGGPDGTPAKCIIGIHHHFVADRLMKSLSEFQIFLIRGGMDVREKESVKQAFINCKAPAVCLLSIKAAGEGIDGLQFACCKAYTFEQQWNMQDIFQFEKRIHRNGQKYPVHIEMPIATGTVEEFFVDLCDTKLQYTTQVEDENWETNPAFLKQLAERVVGSRLRMPSQEDLAEFQAIVAPKENINESMSLADFEV